MPTEMNPGNRHRLQTVVEALLAGRTHAMPDLYSLTSKSLYGKLAALLGDGDLAARALKDTYVQAWHERARFEAFEGREFDLLAAIAHQCALRLRFKSMRDSHATMITKAPAHGGGASAVAMDDRDAAMLKAAYLSFEHPDVLAERFGMTSTEVRARLADLASGKGGPSYE